MRQNSISSLTLDRLGACMLGREHVEYAPHILHFVGLGNTIVPSPTGMAFTTPLMLGPEPVNYDEQALLRHFSAAIDGRGRCALIVLQAHYSMDLARSIVAANPSAIVIAWASLVHGHASTLFTAQLYRHLVFEFRAHGHLTASHVADAFRDACLHVRTKYVCMTPLKTLLPLDKDMAGVPLLLAGVDVLASAPIIGMGAGGTPAHSRAPTPAGSGSYMGRSSASSVSGGGASGGQMDSEDATSNPRSGPRGSDKSSVSGGASSAAGSIRGSDGSSGRGKDTGSLSSEPAAAEEAAKLRAPLLEYLLGCLHTSSVGSSEHLYLRGCAEAEGVQACICVQGPSVSASEGVVSAIMAHLLPAPKPYQPSLDPDHYVRLVLTSSLQSFPQAPPGGGSRQGSASSSVTSGPFTPVPPSTPRPQRPAEGGGAAAVAAAAAALGGVVRGANILEVPVGTDIGWVPAAVEGGLDADQRRCPACKAVNHILMPMCAECDQVFDSYAGQPDVAGGASPPPPLL